MTEKQMREKLDSFIESREGYVKGAFEHVEKEHYDSHDAYEFVSNVLMDNYTEIKGALYFAHMSGLIDDDMEEEYFYNVQHDMDLDRRKAACLL